MLIIQEAVYPSDAERGQHKKYTPSKRLQLSEAKQEKKTSDFLECQTPEHLRHAVIFWKQYKLFLAPAFVASSLSSPQIKKVGWTYPVCSFSDNMKTFVAGV